MRRFQLMLREMGREGWELFVPIRHGAGTLGCAVLWGKEGNRPFRETELSFLTSLFFVFTTSLTARLNSDEVRETRNRSEKITRFFSTHGLAQRQISDTLHMVHSSPIMKDIRGAIDRAANAGEPLLITGEVGTGKELVARLIHALGPHKAEPFELIKCASVPSGGWEHSPALAPADHVKGVVFFDDVAAIPVPVQAELLRMLQQTGHMPFQFIFGAAALPGDLAAVGGVDPGLLQMISGATIDMHPLRHRREDIPGIISHFLERYATEMGSPVREIDEEAMEALVRYRWPGNIVELENVLTRALAGAGSMTLTLRDLPVLVQESKSGADGTRFTGASADDAITGTFEELTQAYAKELILKALRRANGNKSRAAAILGIKRGRLIYQLKELGIQDTEAAAGAEP
ncbi:MAG: sigma-54-dependent Fis family transcriptional regulator [Spirochaetia bacterium]|nr:sigma-54-dependent Fis family transcriptional regulator [Spirochaetia bacterium]